MNHWIFLRHGESVANKKRVFSGHHDVPLTDLGRQQAVEAGIQINNLLAGKKLAFAVSSDLVRAEETARLALAAVDFDGNLQTSPALRERHLGQWQGRSIDALKRSGEREILFTWEGHAPDGESLADIAIRATRFLRSIPPHETTLVVAHGGIIRALLGLLDQTDRSHIGTVTIANAEPIERWISKHRWLEIFTALGG